MISEQERESRRRLSEQLNKEGDEATPFPLESVKKQEEGVKQTEEVIKQPDHRLKFTLDGEVLVKVIKGNPYNGEADRYEEMPLKTVPLWPVPDYIKQDHIDEMALIHSIITTIRKNLPTRTVPVTYREFAKSGGCKKRLRKLVEAGFVKTNHVGIVSAITKKNTGSRLCLYFTPQGRALVRDRFDPSYALTDYQ